MGKKLFSLLSFLLILFASPLAFENYTNVFAQELPSLNFQCMAVTQVGGHSVALSTKEGNLFTPAGSDVYIVECVSSENGNACSTGDSSADSFLGLSGMSGFTITNSFSQPVKASMEGKTEGEPHVRQTDGPDVNHSFFGANIISDTTFSASGAVPKFSSFYPTNSDTNCGSLRWDPTGIVFDSKTLEPITGVPVTIFNKDGSKVNLAGVPNPDTTGENGQYNFNVEANKYYTMTVASSAYTFPSKIEKLPFQNDPDFPYRGIYRGSLFYETPRILRLDIPLDTITPYSREAKITDWKYILDKPLNLYKIDGGVTHPFSTVKVFNADKLDGWDTADQYGKFIVSVDSLLIDPTQPMKLTVEKASIYNRAQAISLFTLPKKLTLIDRLLSKIITPALAQQNKEILINPIPNYLEGYAYNNKGEIVPNATVQIVLTVANKPSYSATADENGYFKIPSQNIPPLPYNLVIQAANGTSSTLTTTQFASFNKKYAQANNVRYGEYQASWDSSQNNSASSKSATLNQTTSPPTNQNTSGSTNTTSSNTRLPGNGNENGSGTSSGNPSQIAKNKSGAYVLILLVLIILACGAGAFYLYKKKKSVENQEELTDVSTPDKKSK